MPEKYDDIGQLKLMKSRLQQSMGGRIRRQARLSRNLTYMFGSQWAKVMIQGQNWNSIQLPRQTDPERPQVRVTVNQLRTNVTKFLSKLRMPTIKDLVFEPQSESNEDRDVAQVGTYLLQNVVADAGATDAVMDLCKRWLLITGSTVAKQTLRKTADPVIMRDPFGKPVGEWQMRRVEADMVVPTELSLDPANAHHDLAKHEWIIHSEPRSADWIKDVYGVRIEDKVTMGQLMKENTRISMATGRQFFAPQADESKTPAGMVHEMYYNTESQPRGFPSLSVWCPQVKEGNRDTLLFHGKSPYPDNPFLKLDMFPILANSWGQGLVDQGVDVQDMMNIAWSMVVNHIIFQSNNPVEVERGSFDAKELLELIRNRQRGFVIREPGAAPAQRLSPVPLGQGTALALGQVKDLLRNLMYVEDPVFGQTSKRGESGRAMLAKLGEATSVMQDVAEMITKKLPLFLTSFTDTVSSMIRPDQMLNMLQERFTEEQIANWVSREPKLKQLSAEIKINDVLVRTPAEVKADLLADVQVGILDPVQARHEYYLETGKGLDSSESLALEYARRETFRILEGTEAEPRKHEDHLAHLAQHRRLLNSPQRDRYPPESLDRLELHMEKHELFLVQQQTPMAPEAGGELPPEPPQMPPEGTPQGGLPLEPAPTPAPQPVVA